MIIHLLVPLAIKLTHVYSFNEQIMIHFLYPLAMKLTHVDSFH